MARSKPKTIRPIGDLAQANAAMGEIAELKRELAKVEAAMNDEIDHLKAEAEALAAPFQTKIKAIEGGLQAFAEYNKAMFDEKRSKKLDFGAIGFRKSSEVKPKPKTTWAMVLGKIKEMGFKQAIRTKEDVNKDELHTWPDERLGLVEARRVRKDVFWYEVDEEHIADKNAA